MEPVENCVVAFSISPDEIARSLEHKAPTIKNRLNALKKLQDSGWKTGLRFDPLIYHEKYLDTYVNMFRDVFDVVSLDQLHSVSLGTFRMPESFFKNMLKLYPDEKMFAGPLEKNKGLVMYKKELEEEMTMTCREKLLQHIPEELLYSCQV